MTTPKLALDEMQPSQSQPHLIVNEGFRRLEAATQISVVSADLATPPAGAVEGQFYIVATGGTGSWSGHDDDIAFLMGGAWAFLTPVIGWIAYDQYNDEYLSFSGSAWAVLALGGGGGGAGHDPFHLLTIAANAITLDLDNYGDFAVDLTANLTSILYSGIVSGDMFHFRLMLRQDATGGRTVTPPSTWLYPSGVSAYSASSGAGDIDLVEGVSFNGGDTWLVTYEKDYA